MAPHAHAALPSLFNYLLEPQNLDPKVLKFEGSQPLRTLVTSLKEWAMVG